MLTNYVLYRKLLSLTQVIFSGAYHGSIELRMNLSDKQVPPKLEKFPKMARGVHWAGLPVVLLQPGLSGTDEVDNLQFLAETETYGNIV